MSQPLPASLHMASVPRSAVTESPWIRRTLIGLALLVVFVFLILPLLVVFYEALNLGAAFRNSTSFWTALKQADFRGWWKTVSSDETGDSILLTLKVAAIAVPLNTLFGLAAAWLIAKFDFRGKSLLTTIIDLPFSISPIIAGMMFVLLFGAQGWLPGGGEYTIPLGFTSIDFRIPQIIFQMPGIVLATVFITFPFVARELIPLMQSQGNTEEQAARVLGASGFQTFFRVTLPNIKWGLLYGVILCNARAMGEFGAVYVVSANHAGQYTLPLQVERVYYASFVSVAPAFAVASLLALVGLVTLVAKTIIEWRARHLTTEH